MQCNVRSRTSGLRARDTHDATNNGQWRVADCTSTSIVAFVAAAVCARARRLRRRRPQNLWTAFHLCIKRGVKRTSKFLVSAEMFHVLSPFTSFFVATFSGASFSKHARGSLKFLFVATFCSKFLFVATVCSKFLKARATCARIIKFQVTTVFLLKFPNVHPSFISFAKSSLHALEI